MGLAALPTRVSTKLNTCLSLQDPEASQTQSEQTVQPASVAKKQSGVEAQGGAQVVSGNEAQVDAQEESAVELNSEQATQQSSETLSAKVGHCTRCCALKSHSSYNLNVHCLLYRTNLVNLPKLRRGVTALPIKRERPHPLRILLRRRYTLNWISSN